MTGQRLRNDGPRCYKTPCRWWRISHLQQIPRRQQHDVSNMPSRKTTKKGKASQATHRQDEEHDEDMEVVEEEEMALEEEEEEGVQEEEDGNIAAEPAAKRKKTLTCLDEEQEESMVEWLINNPVIYNKKMRDYKDTSMKERLWTAKAAEIGKEKRELQTWYKSVRTRYGRLKKKSCASGAGDLDLTERDKWILDKFEFLRPFIAQMFKRVAVSVKAKVDAAAAMEPETLSECEVILQPTSPPAQESNPSICSTMSTRPRKKQIDEDVYAGRDEILRLQKQLLERLNKPQPVHERDAFCDYLRSVMYGLDNHLWRKCQMEMLQKFQELNEVHQQRQHEPFPPAARPPVSQAAECAPGPSFQVDPQRQQSCSVQWQPHPSQWPSQPINPTSVWGSQESAWVQQQHIHQPARPMSTPPARFSSTPQTSRRSSGTSLPTTQDQSANQSSPANQSSLSLTGLTSLLYNIDTQQIENTQSSQQKVTGD